LRFVDARNETAACLRRRVSGAQIAASKACPELVEEDAPPDELPKKLREGGVKPLK
jgi:hypothetical protein